MGLSFQLSFIALVINVVLAKYIDDDDPAYTSTDPAVREPRPCEGKTSDVFVCSAFYHMSPLTKAKQLLIYYY